MKIIFSLIMIFSSFNTYAGILGPSNYEECMNDGKVGRNLSEIQLKNKECRNKFPVLPSIKNKTTKSVDCHFNDVPTFVFSLQLNSNSKTAITGKNNADVISFTEEILLLRYFVNGKEVNMRVNYLNGNFSLSGGESNIVDSGKCSERR